MRMSLDNLALFALDANSAAGGRVAAALGVSLAPHEIRAFEDGEHKGRPLGSVRGRDCFVLASLHGDGTHSVNDRLCRLMFFAAALKDAGAARVTAVAPYLCYSRKDRRTKTRDPVTTRYLAQVLEAVGIDRVVTMDVHNLAAFENAFRCPTVHLEARPLFIGHFVQALGLKDTGTVAPVVLSPDIGGMKRAERFRQGLEKELGRPVGIGFMEKQRSSGQVSSAGLVAAVQGHPVIIIDDLISSGGTMLMAAIGCREQGATSVHVAATHGVFAKGADKVLGDSAFDGVVVADTIAPIRLDPGLVQDRVTVLDTAPLLAQAIRRLHLGLPVSELVEM
jgi:ribose-phosphate pyrophosphokinase